MAPNIARSAKLPRMNLTQDNRLSVTLVLYLCTLVGLLTCGFHQGQMSGQHLSGAGVVFCNLGSDSLGIDLDDHQQHQLNDLQANCPLCSSLGHGTALAMHGWSLDYLPASPASAPPSGQWARPPPRYSWPSINPRASPSSLDAAPRAV